MVKTKTANGQDQDRLGQDLEKMDLTVMKVLRPVFRPRPDLRPSSLSGTGSVREHGKNF